MVQRDLDEYGKLYDQEYATQSFETKLAAVRRSEVIRSIYRYPHHSLLEVGCGYEPLFPDIPDAVAVTAIEPSRHLAKKAAARAVGRSGVTVIEGCLEEQGGQARLNAPFDMIVASSVLHEVPSADLFIESIRSLMSQTTILHINVPNVRSFHRLLALEMGLIHDLFEPSERATRLQQSLFYDISSLSALLRKHQFEVINHGTWLIKPFTHSQMESILNGGCISHDVIEGLSRLVKWFRDHGCELYVEARLI